jgi:hypothetical protein
MHSGLTFVCIFALAVSAAEAGPRHDDSRIRQWRRSTFNVRGMAGALASAAVGQARDRPHEWGQGAGAFAKRFISGFGTHVVKGTIETGVAVIHHENLRYQRSNLTGAWPRIEYALKSTFMVPRSNGDGKTVSVARISGAVGGGLISRLWQPASVAGVGAGFATGGILIGADLGVNVAREFWPHKHHKP